MFTPKSLRHMAAPADWQVRFKCLWKFFGGNLTPLDGSLFRAQQCGPVIMPVNLVDGFTAIRARPAAIPLLGNAPHRASLQIVFNLAETFLPAVLALWPAGTLVEVNSHVFALQNIARGFSCIHVHRRRLSRFGTSHQALARILQIGTYGLNEANHYCPVVAFSYRRNCL